METCFCLESCVSRPASSRVERIRVHALDPRRVHLAGLPTATTLMARGSWLMAHGHDGLTSPWRASLLTSAMAPPGMQAQ